MKAFQCGRPTVFPFDRPGDESLGIYAQPHQHCTKDDTEYDGKGEPDSLRRRIDEVV